MVPAPSSALWLEEGCPEGQEKAHWGMAAELVAIEDGQQATLKPIQQNLGPMGEPIEPLEAVENAGESPTFTDQGEGEKSEADVKTFVFAMSRAFVKEDAEALEELPDRRISPHSNDVTQQGLTHLEAMLNAAREAHVVALAAQDRAAMAHASRELRYRSGRRASACVIPCGTISHVSP